MKLLYATQNAGKLKEARAILAVLNIEVLSPADFPKLKNLDVEETGNTFQENALIKARAFAKQAGVLAAGEDFGLEVAVLDGKPGVHSKRWVAGSDEDRNKTIIEKLKSVENRKARYINIICLYNPKDKHAEYFTGEVLGSIATEIKGQAGFGYDPIFIPDGYGQTFAELGTEVKNEIGHRAQALRKMKQWLEKNSANLS